jgi:two-component system KDP operon response regulator KdpE
VDRGELITVLNKACILLVDDEPAIVRVLRASLVAHGFEVVSAACGEDALEQARTA